MGVIVHTDCHPRTQDTEVGALWPCFRKPKPINKKTRHDLYAHQAGGELSPFLGLTVLQSETMSKHPPTGKRFLQPHRWSLNFISEMSSRAGRRKNMITKENPFATPC